MIPVTTLSLFAAQERTARIPQTSLGRWKQTPRSRVALSPAWSTTCSCWYRSIPAEPAVALAGGRPFGLVSVNLIELKREERKNKMVPLSLWLLRK